MSEHAKDLLGTCSGVAGKGGDDNLVITLPTSHSGKGLTYWKKVLECPRRVALSATMPEYTTEGMARGTLAHAMLEHFFGMDYSVNQATSSAFEPDAHPALAHLSAIVDARRVAVWALQNVFSGKRDHLGHIVGAEVAYSSEEWAWRLGVPGGEPLTARLDLLLDITDAHLETWANLHANGGAVYPGRWVVDYKVYKDRLFIRGQQEELHALWYPLAATAPEQRIEGIIYLNFIATRLPALEVTVVPLHLNAYEILQAFFRRVSSALANGSDVPHPQSCVSSFGKKCPHLNAGCARY